MRFGVLCQVHMLPWGDWLYCNTLMYSTCTCQKDDNGNRAATLSATAQVPLCCHLV